MLIYAKYTYPEPPHGAVAPIPPQATTHSEAYYIVLLG